jgi:putative acetyltransferase
MRTPSDAAGSIRIEQVSAGDPASYVAMARTLLGEYAAMPHTIGRWANAAADIAALPHPYVPPLGAFLIAFDGGRPVGCGALQPFDVPVTGELKRIYVRPDARGKGIGRLLTESLIQRAATLGYTRLVLDTAPELSTARALYAELGFVGIPHYRDGLLPDTLCFERAVTPGDSAAGRHHVV